MYFLAANFKGHPPVVPSLLRSSNILTVVPYIVCRKMTPSGNARVERDEFPAPRTFIFVFNKRIHRSAIVLLLVLKGSALKKL